MNCLAAYTKSGGSWLRWMLIDILYDTDLYLDLLPTKVLREYLNKTERIKAVAPEIHLIRHPLDVLCSAFNYSLLTNRIVQADQNRFINYFFITGYLLYLNRTPWVDFVTWADSHNPITIKYNDLVEAPFEVLKGVHADETKILKAIDKYSLSNVREREQFVDPVVINRITNRNYSFFNRATSFYYEDLLTEDQIIRGLTKFKPQIQKYWPDTLEKYNV